MIRVRKGIVIPMQTVFKGTDWRKTRLRESVRDTLERVSQRRHNPKIRYIVLFGSEARGEAVLTSDVDIALISDEPLTVRERTELTEILGDFPEYRVINTLTCDLNSNKFTDVNYHIKKDGLVIYER